MADTPLSSVSSEANREVEQQIVAATVASAVKLAQHRDTNDPFLVAIEGIAEHQEFFLDSVHTLLISHIKERAEHEQLILTHATATTCVFYLKPRP